MNLSVPLPNCLSILNSIRIRLSVILILWCAPLFLFGQGFKGTVLNSQDGKPVPFANVYMLDLHTGTSADQSGVFYIEHSPSKRFQIQISALGFENTAQTIDLAVQSEATFNLQPSHIGLEEVVVSVPTGKLRGENVVKIEQRKLKDLQSASPTTLAEAIANIPGVDQTTTGSSIGKPVIRGLSGNRIVTYAQGIRIENQQWGEEHGLGVGDVGIEGVEVIKGPASLLYGSDALGGVLYFIDERYAKHNTIEGFISSKFLSTSAGSQNNMGMKLHKGRVKLNIFGTSTSHADYTIPGGNKVFNTRFGEENIKTSIGVDHNNWIANVRYSYLQNTFGITEDSTLSTGVNRHASLPFQKVDNHNLTVENTIYAGTSKINFVVGRTSNGRMELEDDFTVPDLNIQLNTTTYNLKWSAPTIKEKLNFIAGVQRLQQENINTGVQMLIPDATTTDAGSFLVANYSGNKIELQSGVRLDYRKIDTKRRQVSNTSVFPELVGAYRNFNYSLGAVLPGPASTYRFNISSGFRAPTTSELLSDGEHEGTSRWESGNPYLSSEIATQLDFTYEFSSEHFNFSFNPFLNSINNFIYLAPTGTFVNGVPNYSYVQTAATLYGGETGIHLHPHGIDWLHIESNLSTVLAQDAAGTPLPLIPATRTNTTLKVEFAQKSKTQLKNVFLQHTYKFQQNRVSAFETPTDAYHLINLGMRMDFMSQSQPIEFTMGVRNLFNATYIDHLSRLKQFGLPNQGLNFYIGLRFNLDGNLGRT